MVTSVFRRLLLLGVVAAVLPTSNLHGQTVTLRGGSTLRRQVAPGATVAVPVVLDLSAGAGTNVSSLTLGVAWGATRLRFDSIKAGSFGAVTSNVSGAPLGNVSTSVFDAAGTTSTVTMATAYFTAAATTGGTRISFNPTVAGSDAGVSVLSRFRTQPLDVCVAASGFWGDANGDNSVNIIDAQQIARYSVGLSVVNVTALTTQSDVNADGDVNIIDAQQIARFSVELPAAARVNTTLFVQPAVDFMNFGSTPSGLRVGGSVQLSARLYDSFEAPLDGCAPVAWSSSAPAVATVDSTGRVSGVSAGTVVITATSGTASTTAELLVGAGAGSAASIAVVAGDQQWGYVSGPLPVAAQVIVRDSAGAPVPNAAVTFTVSAGTLNSGTPLTVNTDASGMATATQWYAPASGSTAAMKASVGGAVPDASLSVNIIPAPIGQTSCMYDVWGNRCWGNGTRGQLGNGSNSSSAAPVSIIADLTGFRIAAGGHFGDHFCGLDAGGAAYCWGSNNAGQLGDGSRVDRNVPTAVAGGLTFTMLATGTQHTCGVTTAGDIYCWGISFAGQLGDSTIGTSRVVPTKAKTPAGLVFTQVAAGFNHTCATTTAGDVYCWGINSFGQLGDGTVSSIPRPYPALITGGLKLTRIAAGPSGGCGLTVAGAAWCWGSNSNGQLGNGSLTTSPAPVLVQGGHVFSAITMGLNRTCGEKGAFAENTVWCWGANSSALANGTFLDRSQPTLLPYTLSQVSQFGFSGVGHACGLAVGGSQVFCSGANTSGQLGDGTTTTRANANSVIRAGAVAGAVAFMQPTGGNTMVPQSAAAGTLVPIAPEVVVGDGSSNPVPGVTVTWMVQTGGGSVASATSVTDSRGFASSGGWTLGAAVGEQKLQASVSGVFVNGSPAPNLAATFIAYGTNTPASALKISGDSGYSSTNNGGSPSVPQVVKVLDASSNPIPNVAVTFTLGSSSGSLRSGSSSATVTTDANGLAALPDAFWLPNGAQPSTSTLTATVAGMGTPLVFTHFKTVGNFDIASCALTAAGAAMCAGLNTYGGVGDGTTTNRSTFTPVSGSLTFTSLAEGISTTKCGLVGTKAYCWGLNSMGSVGDSTQVNRLAPVAVTGGLSFTKLFTQAYTSCGLTTGNQLYCWGFTGDPGWGEGEGMRGRIHLAPTLVNTDGLAFSKIGLSDNGMCGLTTAGAIYCRDGRFRGDGSTAIPTAFVQWPGGPWTDIAVGNTVTCALDAAGHAFCLGGGTQGGAGIGTINGVQTNAAVPTQVLGGVSFADIHAGNFRVCARRSNGELYCWGITPGNGSFAIADRPTLVPGLNVSSVRITTFRNECAKTTTSLLYCWGSNSGSSGTVGDGTTIDRASPVAIPNWPDGPPAGVAVAMYPDVASYTATVSAATATPPSVTLKDRTGAPVVGATVTFSASAGNGTVTGGTAVTNASGVAMAGSWTMPATAGAVGLDVTASGVPPIAIPATVLPAAATLTITAGNNQLLPDFYTTAQALSVTVRDSLGAVITGMPVTFTVGAGSGTIAGGASFNSTVVAGVATTTQWTPPTALGTYTVSASVPGLAPVTFTAKRLAWQNNGASNPSAALCRLNAAGAAFCWGGNNQGEVGDGSNTSRFVPTAVAGGLTFASLASGDAGLHHCALTAAGKAYCWGNNDAGQLGDGTQANSNAPVAVSGGLTFSSLATGPFASCGITSGSTMVCWGLGSYSFRGDGELFTLRTAPTTVATGGRTFVRIAIGGRDICALDASGQAFCWGDNYGGQLGNGTTTSSTTPQATSTALRFTQLAAGFDFNCGVTAGGVAACWGYNGQGSIGNGSTTNQTTPLVVAAVTGALEVRAGVSHVCSRNSASVFCWGADYSGQVGDGVTTSTPHTIPSATGAGAVPLSIAAFSYSASCFNSTKQLYCWGYSTGVGDGTGAARPLPTAVQWPEASAGDVATTTNITPTSLIAAAGSPQTVTVQVKNAFGALMPSVAVDFVVTSGGGSVSVATVVTDATGRASTTWTLAGSTGTVGTLEARVTSIPSLVFTGTVGSLSGSMSITGGNNQYVPDFSTIGSGLQVKVVDGSGNPIANTTVTFTASSGSGTVATAAVNTASDGTANNSTWTTPLAVGIDYTLQASVPGIAPVIFTSRRLAFYYNAAENPSSSACRLNSSGAAYCWGGNAQGQVGDGTITNRNVPVPVAGGLTFTALGTGMQGSHNCALASGGSAYCWGANSAGQLGNGTQTNSNLPVAVVGGLVFKSLSAGVFSTCGITISNALYCWGWGSYSFRGDSTIYTIRTSPTAVNTGGRTFSSVSVGRTAICALDATGQAFCWGENYGGQLGNGSATSSLLPVAASTSLRFTSISLSVNHACGITTTNTVACWGFNANGAVGNGSTTNQLSPLTVSGVAGAVEVRSGEAHSCARTDSGVFCWGSNWWGQVGDGGVASRATPQQVMSGVTPLAMPSFARGLSCATTASQLYCWGSSEAGVGDGTGSGRLVPTAVVWPEAAAGAATITPLTPASITAAAGSPQTVTVQVKTAGGAVAPGATVNFVVTSGGGSVSIASAVTDASGNASTSWTLAGSVGAIGKMEARVSGVPSYAFTGTITGGASSFTIIDGNNQYVPDFQVVRTLSVKVLDASNNPMVGTTVNWSVSAGNGTLPTTATNTDATGIATLYGWSPPTAIGATYTAQASVPGLAPVTFNSRRLAWSNNGANNPTSSMCRLDSAGLAYCWGGNAQGQIGDGTNTDRTAPTAVSGGRMFFKLALGSQGTHNCALASGGQAYCWGNNEAGQLGNGTQVNSNVPVPVSGGIMFVSLATSALSTCGRTTGDTLYCWGWGGWSFRGDGETYTVRSVPTAVNTGGRALVDVAVGTRQICFLDFSGQAFCWGENYAGQLGNGSFTWSSTPVATNTALRFSTLSMGYDFVCGLTKIATSACWGSNGSGSVGNGSTVNQTTPLEVSGISGVLEVRAGEAHACARSSSAVNCWGLNNGGQVGDGTTVNRLSPVGIFGGATPAALTAISRDVSCATTSAQMYCWGAGPGGIGDGTGATRTLPTAVRWPESSAAATANIQVTTPAGGSFSAASGSTQTITVHVVNNLGNPVAAGTPVNFVITAGGGSLTTSATVATDASGNATTGWTLAGASGTVGKLEARITNVPSAVITGTVP
ncbi:hypothetical protein BH09GEM1_BH09GEM1_38900 [soil metagenome]